MGDTMAVTAVTLGAAITDRCRGDLRQRADIEDTVTA
jgi:hypothetical protein